MQARAFGRGIHRARHHRQVGVLGAMRRHVRRVGEQRFHHAHLVRHAGVGQFTPPLLRIDLGLGAQAAVQPVHRHIRAEPPRAGRRQRQRDDLQQRQMGVEVRGHVEGRVYGIRVGRVTGKRDKQVLEHGGATGGWGLHCIAPAQRRD